MRVAGDAEQCRHTARQLLRAAEAVGRTAQEVQAVWDGVPSWTGTAADAWAGQVLAQARGAQAVADRLGEIGRSLADHAEALEDLQARGRSVAAEAREQGLVVSAEGHITVPDRPLPGAAGVTDALWTVRREYLERLRSLLEAEVRRLRAAESEAHDTLARTLDRLGEPTGPDAVALPLTWWDAPPPLVEAAVGALARGSSGAAVAARGVGRAVPFAGPAYGIAVDMTAGDRSAAAAVGRAAVSTGAGLGAVAALGTFAGGAALVAAAPVAAPVLVATVVGVVTLAALDAVLPEAAPDARRVDPRVRPQPAPRPGEPARATPAGCAPRPPARRPEPEPSPGPAPR